MSFKRDGNDENLLRNLNHQRVRVLLSNHIPQDEAKLLSNGRLTCMICLNRPIFDTINMLAIHRRGKRHMFELSKYIQCKEDAAVRALQRKHPLCKDATTSEPSAKVPHYDLLTNSSQSSMLGSKHVEAKKNVFKHRRKPCLEVLSSSSAKIHPTSILSCPDQETIPKKSASATIRHYLKSISRKFPLDKIVEKNRENYGIDLKCENQHKTETSQTKTKMPTTPNSNSPDYEIKLRMSGWIKDSSGKWIKDPNVEFDSDDDETLQLPST